jgi:hypothetical protein
LYSKKFLIQHTKNQIRKPEKHPGSITILKLFDADPGCKKFLIRHTKNQIRKPEKHPGSITILKLFDADPGCKKFLIRHTKNQIRCGSRILIRGSMPLTNGSVDPDPGSGSSYFRHRPSRCQQKRIQSGQWIGIRIRNPDPEPGSVSVLVSSLNLWIRIRKKLIRIRNTASD